MKIIVLQNNYWPHTIEDPQGYYFLADSAMINTGKPFYVPQEEKSVAVKLGVAIKINRLGKNINEKFASRYYSEYAPVLHFSFPRYESLLEKKGLSVIAAQSFDKSLFVGEFKPVTDFSQLTLRKDGEKEFTFVLDKLIYSIDEVINHVSKLNTLKMGDLILPGETLATYVEGGKLLEVSDEAGPAFKVRVK